MTDNRNADEAPRAPAISITVRGGQTKLVVSAPMTIIGADPGSRSDAAATAPAPLGAVDPPFWARSSVLWSAAAAVAAIATAILTWWFGG
ncbi:hypothetical protein ABZ714_26720 [Streptomyces sp. NPDC006798]|uniref:hypothetical protein n=1 Tax=Streptomyces sp. NPDC006798 TaxID=3155462 RepID=UPI0033C1ED0D